MRLDLNFDVSNLDFDWLSPRYALFKLQRLVHHRWDIFHRCIRDIKLSLQYACRGAFLQCQMHSNYLWGLAYRPYGTGHFQEHKKRLLEVMMSRETWSSCQLFHSMWEDIRTDLGMDPSSSMESVWRQICECRTWNVKGTCPKLGRWFSWQDAAEEQLPEYHVLKLVLAYHHRNDKTVLDPDLQAERQSVMAAARLASRGDGSKVDMRKEFSALKEALGGGTRLAYFCMSEKLWSLCLILQVCSRPCWTWYSSEVKNVQNHHDSLLRAVQLQTTWMRQVELQELASIPVSRDPQLIRLISEKGMTDCGVKTLELTMHLLMRRSWSFARHGAPPDCYASLLSQDVVAQQDTWPDFW